MEIRYVSIDSRSFKNEQDCIKNDNLVLKIKMIFDKLVDDNFFENYKIPTFYHNREHSNLGKPSKGDFGYYLRGYIIVHGKMGNGNTWITFKLRKNKLLIFKEEMDGDFDKWQQKRYYGCIDITKYLDVCESRRLKIEKIVKKIKD